MWLLSTYKNCIELDKLDWRTLLSTVKSHITSPQQTAAKSGNANFLYTGGSAFYHLSWKYFLYINATKAVNTRLKRYKTIWWLTGVCLPKINPPKINPERKLLMLCLPNIFSSINEESLYEKTKSPRFFPCYTASLKIAYNYLRLSFLKSIVITRLWTKRTLLPYSRPFLRPLKTARIYFDDTMNLKLLKVLNFNLD